MAMAASSLVLSIVELLEQIFHHVPQHDLILNVQGTCRRWRDIVLTLPDSYLDNVPDVLPTDVTKRPPPQQFNPLLLKHFRPFFPYHKAGLDYFIEESCRLHLAKEYYPEEPRGPRLPAIPPNTRHLCSMSIASRGDKHRAFARPSASWRKMQLASPPITTLRYTRPDGSTEIAECPDGLRMGPLYDLLIEGGVGDISSHRYAVVEISWAIKYQINPDELPHEEYELSDDENPDSMAQFFDTREEYRRAMHDMRWDSFEGRIEEIHLVKSYNDYNTNKRKHKHYGLEIAMNTSKQKLMCDGWNQTDFIVRP